MRGGGGALASLLESVIGGMDSGTKIRESLALAYWPRVVGAQAAAASEPEAVRDGVLFVRTKSSTWSHELTLHKARIVQNLNRLLGERVILDIVYRARGVKKETSVAEPEMPTPEELAAVVLEPPEKAELRGHLKDLYLLENDRVRQAIAARLTQEAKLRHWRLEHGWRICPRCSATHKTDYTLCPICRLCR
ncbi:MAG TPA: DUF721 domain-containing protein [Chthonomonadaceae bacterium]|nr:DUF721 domain-containing protein [Chthonomonadaceae bacterium]